MALLLRHTLDPAMRGVLSFGGRQAIARLSFGDAAAPAALPNFGPDDALVMGAGAGFDLEHRILAHPGRADYLLMQQDATKAWCIGKAAQHHGRSILFLASLQGAAASDRRELLRDVLKDAMQQGHHAAAMWVHRRRLGETMGVFRPFLPVARKQFAVLKTPFAGSLLASGAQIGIELLDTDKI